MSDPLEEKYGDTPEETLESIGERLKDLYSQQRELRNRVTALVNELLDTENSLDDVDTEIDLAFHIYAVRMGWSQ